jgi:hypothetical protein
VCSYIELTYNLESHELCCGSDTRYIDAGEDEDEDKMKIEDDEDE